MTSADPLRVKGSLVSSVCQWLRGVPGARGLLRADVAHYLEDTILAASWYPADDFFALMEAALSSIPGSEAPNGAAYRMGEYLARRDLAGDESYLPEEARSGRAGTYRRLIEASNDLPSVVKRLARLTELYFDRGEMLVELSETNRSAVVLRLSGVDLPRWWCDAAVGFMEAAGGLKRMPTFAEHRECVHRGGTRCVWQLTFSDEVDVAALLRRDSSLPPPRD